MSVDVVDSGAEHGHGNRSVTDDDRSAADRQSGDGRPPSDEYVPAVHRPTTVSGAAAVLLGFVAITRLVPMRSVVLPMAATVFGISLFAAGTLARTRGQRLAGWGTVVAGAICVFAALGVAASHPDEVVPLVLVPAVLGLAILSAAVVPIRGSGSRALARVGSGLLLLSVLVVGAIGETTVAELVVAFVAIVIAWDSADNAIGLGRQIGRTAPTLRAELAHIVGTITAGLAGIGITRTVGTVGSAAIGLVELFLLLLAAVVFVVALAFDLDR